MKYLLLVVIVTLGVMTGCGRNVEAPWPRPLPDAPPDFAAVRAEVEGVAEAPWFLEHFELEEFAHDRWLARVWLRSNEPIVDPAGFDTQLAVARQFVRQVCERTGLPGRVAGTYREDDISKELRGLTVEFGYSDEVGYDRPNPELKRAK